MRTMARRQALVWIGFASVGAIFAVTMYRYTYPSVQSGEAAASVIAVERQWWRGVSIVALDLNANGVVDFRASFPGASGNFHTHQIPLESWEDRDENGNFEIHAIFKEGSLDTLELDLDEDGKAEVKLRGPEAQARMEELQHVVPRNPGAAPKD